MNPWSKLFPEGEEIYCALVDFEPRKEDAR
jgi:hypothetical protein